jgi:transposase-like protein
MRKTRNGKEFRSSAEWQQLLSKYERSGLSVTEFCESEGLKRNTFDKWREQLKGSRIPGRTKQFIELVPARAGYEVIISNGVRVQAGTAQAVAELLKELDRC